MLHTYKAMLRGNRVEWLDAPPPDSRPTAVHITLLEEENTPGDSARGREMLAPLEALANAGGLRSVPDPVAWQREVRQDRLLPGRGE